MKKLLLLLPILMTASAFANENEEVTFCRFKAKEDKDHLRCRAKIVERGGPIAVDEDVLDRDRVKLEVDCSNGFDAHDEWAKKIEERKSDVIVSVKDDQIVLLQIEEKRHHDDNVVRDENRDEEHKKLRATLIISEKDKHDDTTVRLKGECVEKDEHLLVDEE